MFQRKMLPPSIGYLTEDCVFCYQEFKGKVKHDIKFFDIRQNFSTLLAR